MPKKGTFWDDTLEQGTEFASKTAKASVKAVTETLNPFSSLKSKETLPKEKKDSHTPLNFEKLEKQYKNQDTFKTDKLRQTYFQRVKSEEEKVLMDKKKTEQEKEQMLIQEKQQKERQKALQAQQPSEAPRGKQRRSIFSKKRAVQSEQAEMKPSSGKQ